jgi:DNA modification methylase
VGYTGGSKARLTIENDEIGSNGEFQAFLTDALRATLDSAKKGAPIYVFHGDQRGLEVRLAYRDSGWLAKQVLIWVKDSLVPGRQDYQWRHEAMLYGWKPGAGHYFVKERDHDTIFTYARPKRSEVHPTMKPVALVADAIRNSSKPGWTVLDPFAGSGTTMMAADMEGRAARLIELSRGYCDVIVQRYEEATGEKATRE